MNQIIHVELDALLDTRLATLMRIDPDLVPEAIQKGYRERVSDVWSEIGLEVDQEEYDRLYRSRDVTTLKLARPTAIVPMLTEMTSALGRSSVEDPRIENIGIEVNVWPYRLNEAVKAAIEDAVAMWMPVDCDVTVVDYDRDSLTPDLIDRHHAAVVFYDFDGWFSTHSKALLNKRIPTVSFIAPALYCNGKPDESVHDDGSPVEPFAATELALVEYVTLAIKDVTYFSLVEL